MLVNSVGVKSVVSKAAPPPAVVPKETGAKDTIASKRKHSDQNQTIGNAIPAKRNVRGFSVFAEHPDDVQQKPNSPLLFTQRKKIF